MSSNTLGASVIGAIEMSPLLLGKPDTKSAEYSSLIVFESVAAMVDASVGSSVDVSVGVSVGDNVGMSESSHSISVLTTVGTLVVDTVSWSVSIVH
jgi:hypothetical protein